MPVTTVFGGLFGRGGRWLYHRTSSNSHAALARLGLAERIALTPEGIPAERACRAIDIAVDLRLPVLNFSFHSPSLRPGNTPYVRSQADPHLLYPCRDGVTGHRARARVEASPAAGVCGLAHES